VFIKFKEDKMIYLAKKDGRVVVHTDKDSMLVLDGVTPEMEVSENEYYAADGLVRIIEGEIFLGLTEVEKAQKEKQKKIDAYKAELAAIDQEAGAGRAVRGLALEAAEKAGIESDDYDRLKEFEDKAESLRESISELIPE
jgi:hypothetical protein